MEPMNDIDRILREEEIVSPSSDFTARVMRKVRTEAEAPAPIEFPWRRFLPGALTSLSLVLATFMVLGWMNAGNAPDPASAAPAMRPAETLATIESALSTPLATGLLWAAGALLLSGSLAWWAQRSGRASGSGL
jgi:hypothetical protein